MSIVNRKRKILSIVILLILSISASAQKDVTKFLGIPVDGTKSEMIQKLKKKGFISNAYNKDILEGEFNGNNVRIDIGINNNKVYRIMVCDKNSISETDIKIRFNNLCQQFKKNTKYVKASLSEEYELPDNEDISYGMTVENKRYEASFCQIPEKLDTAYVQSLLSKYTKDQILNPSEEIKKEMNTTITNYLLEEHQNRLVWFMISEYLNKYYISMYYDNGYNRKDGEDL